MLGNIILLAVAIAVGIITRNPLAGIGAGIVLTLAIIYFSEKADI